MGGWGWVGVFGWVAGLTETKTKPNPKLKLELKFGAELCKNRGQQVRAALDHTTPDFQLIFKLQLGKYVAPKPFS